MDAAPPSEPTGSPEGLPPGTPDGEAPRLPWETPGPWAGRAWATVRMILQDPPEAGARLGARKVLGPAIAFAALVGLPFQWLSQALGALWTPLDGGGANAIFLKALGQPLPPPPSPEQLALARVFLGVQVALAPLLVALGVLIMGLLAHGGLWMLRGLERERGLETTYRSLLYVGAATAWVGFLSIFGLKLPESLLGLHLLVNLALGLGVLTFQGIVLAHAHGTQTWRGVLAVFLPLVILFCCLAACLVPAALAAKAG